MTSFEKLTQDYRRICTAETDALNARAMQVASEAMHLREDLLRTHVCPALNSGDNTLPSELKRDAIAQMSVKDFARLLAPLRLLSTTFSDVPLEGLHKVQVPFYDLDSGASASWVMQPAMRLGTQQPA